MAKRTRSQRKEQRAKAERARERGLPSRTVEPKPTRRTRADDFGGGKDLGGPLQGAGRPVWAKVLAVALLVIGLLLVLSWIRRNA